MRRLKYLAMLMAVLTTLGCSEVRFDPELDAQASFTAALNKAKQADRYLMVVFGADWCTDCRKLYEHLRSAEVQDYMREHMDFLTVDVGDKDRNLAFAAGLGVSIDNGIPVAVFFDPTGAPIGTTNQGQLEPSRYLTRRQILRFVSAVVDDRRVTRPVPAASEENQT